MVYDRCPFGSSNAKPLSLFSAVLCQSVVLRNCAYVNAYANTADIDLEIMHSPNDVTYAQPRRPAIFRFASKRRIKTRNAIVFPPIPQEFFLPSRTNEERRMDIFARLSTRSVERRTESAFGNPEKRGLAWLIRVVGIGSKTRDIPARQRYRLFPAHLQATRRSLATRCGCADMWLASLQFVHTPRA